MELDFKRLNSIASVGVKKEDGEKPHQKATQSHTEPQTATGEYKPMGKPKQPLKTIVEGTEGIQQLQRKADENKEALARSIAVYKQYQDNTMISSQLQTEILKGAKTGESIYNLFLKASKAITLMTGNTAFYTQIEAEAKTIYGEGLLQKAPLQIELQETEQRLKRLREAQERELSGDSSQRMKNAIKAHEARIAELQELIKKGAENLG